MPLPIYPMNDTNSKTLFINQPCLILLVGLPGSGKTFFAEKFAQAFNTTFINLNDLRFELFNKPDFSKSEESHLEKIGRSILPELMRSKRAIMLEGCLEARSDRAVYQQIAEENGYRVVTVWFQNTEQMARFRSTKRIKNSPRKNLLTSEQFEILSKRFTEPNLKEKPLVISGNHTFATQTRAVLRRLSERDLPVAKPRPIVPNLPKNVKNRRFIS